MKYMTLTVIVSVDDDVKLPEPEYVRSMLYGYVPTVGKMMYGVTLNTVSHRAEPLNENNVCKHCLEDIKVVPGGQGTTYVHSNSGLVAGYQKSVR